MISNLLWLPVVQSLSHVQLFVTLCQASNEYSGLIYFRIDWFDLLVVTGTLVFSSTTIWKHQFFDAQPSLWSKSYIHTWLLAKIIALTVHTFVEKVISLLFNTLSSFVIAFVSRSKQLLISWLQLLSAGILEPPKMKCHCFHFFRIYLPWSDVTRFHDLSFMNDDF